VSEIRGKKGNHRLFKDRAPSRGEGLQSRRNQKKGEQGMPDQRNRRLKDVQAFGKAGRGDLLQRGGERGQGPGEAQEMNAARGERRDEESLGGSGGRRGIERLRIIDQRKKESRAQGSGRARVGGKARPRKTGNRTRFQGGRTEKDAVGEEGGGK